MKLLFAFAATAAAVTPVQKVIQMLEGMKSKGVKEMADEKSTFAEFRKFCEDTTSEKNYAIKTSLRLMEEASAAILKNQDVAAQASAMIAELQAAIAQAEAELKEATELREQENADYEVSATDYTETQVAISGALAVLKKQDFDRSQAASLLQTVAHAKKLPVGGAHALMNYFNGVVDPEEKKTAFMSAPFGQPEVHASKSHMGGVIDMLADMGRKIDDEKATLDKEEANKAHAYNMVKSDLTSQLEYDNRQLNRKIVEKTTAEEAVAKNTGALERATNDKNSDEKYNADLDAACRTKSDEFAARQKLRNQELQALDKAINIISSGSLAGKADKHLPTLVQVHPHSFIQTDAVSKATVREHTLEFLKAHADSLKSVNLSLAAAAVAADPFAKVKGLIGDLIAKLKEEAKAEATHKAWCDKELKENKLTREKKTQESDVLNSKIEKRNANIAELQQRIGELSDDIQALDAAMKEATDVRNKEKAKNLETISDAKEAQAATAQAVVVLKEFYGKAAKATSLVQGVEDDLPGTWSAPYKGQQDGNSGVIGMLEVIDSDFARLEAETTASETEASNAYDKFMKESQDSKQEKYDSRLADQRQQKTEEFELSRRKKDLKATTEQLDLANTYYEKLQGDCIKTGLSYEDRVRKREEEIEAMKQALTFLEQE